jgi:alpha-D-xyloside xylohydrolase
VEKTSLQARVNTFSGEIGFYLHGKLLAREMWFFGGENSREYQTQLKYDKLWCTLLPYIYSLVGMVTLRNYTMMRVLIMDFPKDHAVWDIQDQFMFRPDV